MRRLWAALTALAVLTGCDGSGDTPVALGTLERDRLELIAEASEPILKMHVREGDRVTPGQVLAELDSTSTDARVASAHAQVSAAQNRLRELTQGPRQEEILEARAGLEGAQSAFDSAQREYERIAAIVKRQLLSQSALDQQRAARDRAEAERNQARAQLTLLLKGTRIEELDQARDAVRQAEGELRQAVVVQQRLRITAPRSGVVEALPYKLGERPPTGAPVVVMLADGDTYARVYVPALIRSSIGPGTTAEVTVEGQKGTFPGRVRYVAAEAAFTPYYALTQEDRGRLSYLAEVTLTEARASQLPAGLPVEVRFAMSPPGSE
jgi:HlyD family secretion protein